MSDQITITLPDGSTRELPAGATAGDLAASIGPRLAKAAVIAAVNGTERDLVWPLDDGDEAAIITETDERGLFTIRHSTAHVLAQAVLDLFPGATFAIGPPVENGFYYDFELPDGGTFTPEDLDRIDTRMREIIAERQPFIRDEIPEDDALVLFKDHKYKCEIIRGAADDPMSATETGLVRTYENPPSFIDLCRGPHVPDTGRLGHFKLMRVAGAYWRGDERNPMLQRIYGTAWASKKELEAYLHRLEEAEKRDHRKLAAELDLLSFPEMLGGGLAVWHPKGAMVRKLMEDYSRTRHEQGGYEFAYSPHIARSTLWETSGHLGFYADAMYPPMEMDNGRYYPKPMNCPFHILIFQSQQRSYRELPHPALRARHRVPLRALRHAARAHAHPGVHPGRRPHLLHARSGRRRGHPGPRLRDLGAAGVRLRGLRGQPLDPPGGEVGGHRRGLGPRHRRAAGRVGAGASCPTSSTRAAVPSTGRRSTSRCATPSGGSGSSRPSRPTSTWPTASTSTTSGPTTTSTVP